MSRLINFALVVLQSLIFKVCGVTGMSRIEFFKLSGIERVKENFFSAVYSGLIKTPQTSAINYSRKLLSQNSPSQMFVGVLTKPHFFTFEYTLREKCPYSMFFWSVFSRIRTEYREIPSISTYSVQMRENTDHKNSEYGHFSSSDRDSCSYIAVSRKYRIPENHR